MKKHTYVGTLNRPDMSLRALQGYRSWMNQIQRCTNKNNPDFPRYGGKGIRVRYAAREFIGWWMHQLKRFRGKDPTVSRIDHEKDYCFENIRVESRSDNMREVHTRINGTRKGAKNRRVLCLMPGHTKPIAVFASMDRAAEFSGFSKSAIRKQCMREPKTNQFGHIYRFETPQATP